MEISKEILDFLTGVHGNRSDTEKRKEKIFDRAFELAYMDMARHTVAYRKEAKEQYAKDDSQRCNDNKIKIRNSIKVYIKKIFGGESLLRIKDIDADEFNRWHKDACDSFVNIECVVSGLKGTAETKKDIGDRVPICRLLCHTDSSIEGVFTYGQAQKLINMMVKYLYIFYQCEGWKDLENLKEYAHVPIDSYVLKAVFDNCYYNGTPWSKMVSYKEYEECKKDIDKKAENLGYESPFFWELANWPFETAYEMSEIMPAGKSNGMQ